MFLSYLELIVLDFFNRGSYFQIVFLILIRTFTEER